MQGPERGFELGVEQEGTAGVGLTQDQPSVAQSLNLQADNISQTCNTIIL